MFWVCILFLSDIVCQLTIESVRRRGDHFIVCWHADTFSEISLVVKYDKVNLVAQSLRGVVKVHNVRCHGLLGRDVTQ